MLWIERQHMYLREIHTVHDFVPLTTHMVQS